MGITDILRKLKEFSSANTVDLERHQQNYAIALMLDVYGQASPVMSSREYPLYFTRECNVTNPRMLHQSLVKSGFLVQSSTEDILKTLTVVELKDILSVYNLPKTGRKADLIQRIINSIDLRNLDVFKSKKYYSLSASGQVFLSEHADYVLLHKYSAWQLPFAQYCELREKLGSNQFYAIAEMILKERIRKASTEYDKWSGYFYLSILYNNIDKFPDSLLCYLRVLYLDLNDGRHYTPYTASVFSKDVIAAIASLQEYYTDTMVDTVFHERLTSARYCNKSTFFEILHDVFNEASFPFDKWNSYFYSKAGICRQS